MLEMATGFEPNVVEGRFMIQNPPSAEPVGRDCRARCRRQASCRRDRLRGVRMTERSLQVTYRKGRAFAAYLHLSHKTGEKSAKTVASPDGLLIVDYGATGRPVGVEITSPQAGSLLSDLISCWPNLVRRPWLNRTISRSEPPDSGLGRILAASRTQDRPTRSRCGSPSRDVRRQRGTIELVVEGLTGDPERDWLFETNGAGIMVCIATDAIAQHAYRKHWAHTVLGLLACRSDDLDRAVSHLRASPDVRPEYRLSSVRAVPWTSFREVSARGRWDDGLDFFRVWEKTGDHPRLREWIAAVIGRRLPSDA